MKKPTYIEFSSWRQKYLEQNGCGPTSAEAYEWTLEQVEKLNAAIEFIDGFKIEPNPKEHG